MLNLCTPSTVAVAVALTSSVHAAATITNATMFANFNHNISGVFPNGSDSDSDGITPDPFPQNLSVSSALSLAPTSNGSFMNGLSNGSATIRDDGANGSASYQFEYLRGGTGSVNGTIRLTVIFTVTGGTGYELDAVFFDNNLAGSQVRITEEGTNAFVAGTTTGDNLSLSGTLGDGTYRLTAQISHGNSGSPTFIGRTIQQQMQYDLRFTEIPAPSGLMLTACAAFATIRRRR
ncbi:MAG: hypothetical protein AAGB34_03635 [Planctomycetota bacterium]